MRSAPKSPNVCVCVYVNNTHHTVTVSFPDLYSVCTPIELKIAHSSNSKPPPTHHIGTKKTD